MQCGRGLVRGLNEYLGTSKSEPIVQRLVNRARIDLGQSAPCQKLPPRLARRREEIIDAYVRSNSGMSNQGMEEPIFALLAAEGIPSTLLGKFQGLISASRGRMGLLINPRIREQTDTAARRPIIEGFVRDHIEWTLVSMVGPIQRLLRKTSITPLSDKHLARIIGTIKRELETALGDGSTSPTTENPIGLSPVVAAQSVTTSEKAARLAKVREYILAHPDQKGQVLMDGLCGYLGTTYNVKTVTVLMKQVRGELRLPARSPKLSPAQTRRREEIIDAFVAAHPPFSNFDMEEPIAAQVEAEQIPPTPTMSLPKYISNSRSGLIMPIHSHRPDRRAVIEEFLRDHTGLNTRDMIGPIQQLMRAKNLTKVSDYSLIVYISEIRRELRSTTSSPPTTTTIEPDLVGNGDAEETREDNTFCAKRQRIGEREYTRAHASLGQLEGEEGGFDEADLVRFKRTRRASHKRLRQQAESDIDHDRDKDAFSTYPDDDYEEGGGSSAHADIYAVDNDTEYECGTRGEESESLDSSAGRHSRREIRRRAARRRQLVGEYLVSNPEQRGAALIDGIREFLITKNKTCARPTISRVIAVARVDVGLPTHPPNLPRELIRRRDHIVDEYVRSHPNEMGLSMKKPISDLFEAAGIPKCGFSTIERIILASRERQGLPRWDKPDSEDSAIRKGIITDYIKHHPTLSGNQMAQPIQELLALTVVRPITDSRLKVLRDIMDEGADGAPSDDPDHGVDPSRNDAV